MKTKTPPAKPRRLEEIADSKKGLFAICPTLLSVEAGFNKRENYGDLRQLADDIAANGLDQPLKIRKIEGSETIYIVSGHRRHKAITEILIPEGRWQDPANPKKVRTVDCYAEARGTTRIDRLVSQVSGNTGLPYTLLEKAAVYQEILADDPTVKPADLARRFGESKQAVSDALRLVNDACPEVLKAVRKGTMSATTAITLIKQTGTDAKAQKEALQAALTSANGSGHITPKHLPASASPASGSSSPTPPLSPSPTPTPPAFTLYVIDGAPEEPTTPDGSLFHETDRLVLENPPAGIQRLHLLCAVTPSQGVAYGYRINDIERLPDIGDIESYDAGTKEGFEIAMRDAGRASGLDFAALGLDPAALITAALDRYFPDSGTPEEPKHLAFVGASQSKAPTGSNNPGFQQTMAAPSGGGNGGGGGGSTYLDPQTFKAVEKIEKVLEDLAAKNKGIEERVTTADIVVAVLRNERPASDLKNYLLGK
jgi:ParB-like chromosome segregation protein Spo0J